MTAQQTPEPREDEAPVRTTNPSIKPALIRLTLTLIVAVVAIMVFFLNPSLLGTIETTNIALVVVQVLAIVAVGRRVVKIVVLRNTAYVLTDRAVRREYSLLARQQAREVPYHRVRSHERRQRRIEHLLDIGSIAVNQGLGELTLEAVPAHEEFYDEIQRRMREEADPANR